MKIPTDATIESLMDEISELVYIADMDTYELLYVNQTGKKILGIPHELNGAKCYEVLQNNNRPCDFCTNLILSKDTFYTWEITNPVVCRHFLLKDKIISWGNRDARLEIAFDTTESQQQRTNLKNSLEAENLVNQCAKKLHLESNNDLVLDDIMEIIGTFLESERAYIFEINDDTMSNTHEWCAEGVSPQIDNLQNLEISIMDRWADHFKKRECVIIEDLETIKDISPIEYDILKPQEIHSLIAAPISWENHLVGYVGIDNYNVGKLYNTTSILESIGYFIGSVIRYRKVMDQLRRQSYYDDLTQVMNRNAYTRDVNALKDKGETPVGVLYIDINGMKEINDTYGHHQGDAVLSEVAQKIASIFNQNSLYRVGGDEFVVICLNISKKLFQSKVLDLKNIFTYTTRYDAAVGSHWSKNCSDIQNLLYDADEEMYANKRQFYFGKNDTGRYRHHFDDILGMTKPGKIKQIIKEKQLIPYFQPKINPQTLELCGAEALVRYNSSEEGIILPNRFIPVLEEARLIDLVDFHIFEQVCSILKKWLQKGFEPHSISTNFSRYTITTEGFAERLETIWAKYRVPKEMLEIEITETIETRDSYYFLNVIREIKAKGFQVSIDDFGAKNANLSFFSTIDFDVLKIDQSIINDIPNNRKAVAILESIADICHKMNIKMIAEGVERDEQFQFLKNIPCNGVQGFLFSKPIPQKELEANYLKK